MKKFRYQSILKYLLLLSFTATSICLNAQSWQWLNSGGGNLATGSSDPFEDDHLFDMKTDSWGNMYTLGTTAKTSFTFNGFSGAVWGAQDMFVMKTRCDGSVAWVRFLGGRASGAGGEYANAVVVDNEGGVYVTASDVIYGVASVDSARLGDTTILITPTSPRNDGMITVKFDSTGHFKWFKTYPSTVIGSYSLAKDITFNYNDQLIYEVVRNGGRCIPGTDSVERTYVLKYNKNGDLLGLIKVFDNAPAYFNCNIVTDHQGHFYLSGTYSYPDTQLIITGGDTLPPASTSSRGFVVKYDTSGHFIWEKHTTDGQQFSDLAISSNGAFLAVSGTGGGFYPFDIDTFHLVNPSGIRNSALAVLFDSSGNTMRGMVVGSSSTTSALAVCINNNDQISIGGEGGGVLTFDGDTLRRRSGGNDAFFATLSSTDMHVIHAEVLLGTGFTDGINVLASDARNNLYVGGYIQGNLYEGSDTFVRGLVGGLTDIFLGKYGIASCLCNDASASFTETHTGHSFTYTSTSTNADSLFWIFGDGATQAGGTTANHTYTTGAPHSVCVWAYNDCSRDSSCLVTTGIAGISENQSIEVYPNPTLDRIHVTLSGTAREVLFTVYDLQHRELQSYPLSGLQNEIVLPSSLASGLYIWQLVTDGVIAGNGRLTKE
jgi:hypothetical protein